MAMTAAHFRALRSWLGMSLSDVATALGASGDSARSWDKGRYALPEGVETTLLEWKAATDLAVDDLARHYETHACDWPMKVPRTPEDAQAWQRPDLALPFTPTVDWWKHTGIRVCEQVPGLTLDWTPTPDLNTERTLTMSTITATAVGLAQMWAADYQAADDAKRADMLTFAESIGEGPAFAKDVSTNVPAGTTDRSIHAHLFADGIQLAYVCRYDDEMRVTIFTDDFEDLTFEELSVTDPTAG